VPSAPATMPRPQPWVEAMKRRSRAGGEPVKARRRKAVTLTHRNAPKVTRSPSRSSTDVLPKINSNGRRVIPLEIPFRFRRIRLGRLERYFAGDAIDLGLTPSFLLEAGSEGAAQRTIASIPSPTLAVPASLQASLMARLDRLGSAKEVAQIGAAIGREFSHALLSAVVKKLEPELASALDRLIETGLLFRQGVPPDASYLFKHALVQDAAYGTLLREPRRALHARIADTLETQFAEIVENQPELLARHCTEAGLIEKAAMLWGKAGQRSLERSFTRSLDQIGTLPSTPSLRREQIKLQTALITPHMHVKGYGAPEVKAAAERARLLIEQAEAQGEPPEDEPLLFSALYGSQTI
jgi:hypothetical protein